MTTHSNHSDSLRLNSVHFDSIRLFFDYFRLNSSLSILFDCFRPNSIQFNSVRLVSKNICHGRATFAAKLAISLRTEF